jgi:hypothetical protein
LVCALFWAAVLVAIDRSSNPWVYYALRSAYFPSGSYSPILMQGAVGHQLVDTKSGVRA